MCGRYTLSMPIVAVAEELALEQPAFEVEPRYNIAPTQQNLVLANNDPRVLQAMRWGLVPAWAKDPSIGTKMINARAESLSEKPAFRQALAQRRCLIPANGFYEWQKTPYGKLPKHIHLHNNRLMTFAGLWDIWKDAEGKEMRSYTIITTTPNALMADIHDRMPVILLPHQRATWLDPKTPMSEILGLLQPLEDGLLSTETVSDLVNSARNEGPELLGPPQTLF